MTQCRNEGAKTMTLAGIHGEDAIQIRRASARRNQEKPVDVDEWIDYFGLDRTKI